jgi:hypothetical protein
LPLSLALRLILRLILREEGERTRQQEGYS